MSFLFFENFNFGALGSPPNWTENSRGAIGNSKMVYCVRNLAHWSLGEILMFFFNISKNLIFTSYLD